MSIFAATIAGLDDTALDAAFEQSIAHDDTGDAAGPALRAIFDAVTYPGTLGSTIALIKSSVYLEAALRARKALALATAQPQAETASDDDDDDEMSQLPPQLIGATPGLPARIQCPVCIMQAPTEFPGMETISRFAIADLHERHRPPHPSHVGPARRREAKAAFDVWESLSPYRAS